RKGTTVVAGHVRNYRRALALRAAKDFFQGPAQLILMTAGDHKVRPRLCKAASHCLSQPLTAPGDQRHLSLQVEYVQSHVTSPAPRIDRAPIIRIRIRKDAVRTPWSTLEVGATVTELLCAQCARQCAGEVDK